MNKILTLSALAGLLAVTSQANATVYNIDYRYMVDNTDPEVLGGAGEYIKSQNYDPQLGLDPGNEINGTEYPDSSLTDIDAEWIDGNGTLNTDTGEIVFGPISFQIAAASGNYGFVDWSQSVQGSFSGSSWSWSGTTVLGGSKICEDVSPAPTACVDPSAPAPGEPDNPLERPQDVEVTQSGRTINVDVTPLNVDFTTLGTGGVGTYHTQFADGDPYHDTFIEITIGQQVPVPAAAWLFGSGLLGLASIARKRRV